MTNENISNNSERIVGRDAQRNNILAARVISETVKTTLGPKGMDKMLVDRVGNIIVTNDGVTILEEMEVEHPIAKMIIEIAKTQEKEVGDGTTTAVMIAGKLLENAEKLLDMKIHPTVINRGYRWASEKSNEILKDLSIEINSEKELEKVAQTAMTGKGAEHLREKFSSIVIDAVKTVSERNDFELDSIRIEKKRGGNLDNTELIEGIVIGNERTNLEMPKQINDAKIALVEEAFEIRNPEINANLSISSPEQLNSFISQEDFILKSKVETIKESGANVLFVQKGIDEIVSYYLAREGIYAVSRVSKEDMQGLSKATGAKIISKLNEISSSDLGYASLVEERKEGEDSMTYIIGCKNPKMVTILIRGGTTHVIDEIERAFKDALGVVNAVVKNSKVVCGGGAVEIELSRRLRVYAATLPGRERLAVEEFASSLEFIPFTLAENAGLDPIDLLTELKAAHDMGNKNFGLNLFNNKVEDTSKQGIIEPLKVKTQAISSASEVAMMILRIDDVIAARKSRGRGGDVSRMSDYDEGE